MPALINGGRFVPGNGRRVHSLVFGLILNQNNPEKAKQLSQVTTSAGLSKSPEL
ncbi:MAG: hypothetical protein E7L01_20725 [Paenibacillus macerans]|uniref:Uncharacterized protein n=1 Tax=Paenibacillus macerans TaxID=44252 RepID=A0A090YKL3_PAEMA|nr:hypothetical protein [Paenibacillus macerans]KFM98452.1 hypothetical protein DJ90_4346 [Paenibacillus macerans]MBS5910595.1 hypothetical protein [Paenibacillus macerans]MCY7560453.1 hypothetical protein [Paenibacillus macerans]MDU7475735.1 hypothetical protein [Paenibacillus macerans]MEC0150776.1 hypothetical protein [Paenibacillus macerans]